MLQKNEKTLISFILLAYKQENYIEDAVKGALSQTYSPLEIILSDDNSPDNTYNVMKRIVDEYDGPHRIILNRNPENLGLVQHYNRVVFELSHGDLLVIAAGDDISRPDRALRSWEILSRNPELSCVSFANNKFYADADPLDPPEQKEPEIVFFDRINYFNEPFFHISGASRTIRRSAIVPFGPLNRLCPTEDSTGLLRCILTGPVAESSEALVHYRIHGNNLSSQNAISGLSPRRIFCQCRRDIRKAEELGYISVNIAEVFKNKVNARLKRTLLFNMLHQSSGLSHWWVLCLICLSGRVFTFGEKIQILRSNLFRKNSAK